jgi:drug/metabolite transporter (DMT)-like permease
VAALTGIMIRMREQPSAQTHDLGLPSRIDLGWLALAVCAVSTSGPLIAATVAPALAVAFWRNALAVGVMLPFVAVRRRDEVRRISRREWWLIVGAGALLAAHFATWVPSVKYTSVASATALVASQPVWAALIARARGAAISRSAWTGIVLSVVGAALLTGLDFRVSDRAVVGDLLALAGGVLAAGYVTVGAEVRRTISTATYTAMGYSTTSVVLVVVCLVGRQHLTGYSTDDWLRIVALTVGAQLLGHSVFSRVLRTTSPIVVSLSVLLEVPGAALIAAIFLHQHIRLDQLPAAALLLAGLALVIRSGARAVPAE